MVGFRASAQILKAVAQAQQKGGFRAPAVHVAPGSSQTRHGIAGDAAHLPTCAARTHSRRQRPGSSRGTAVKTRNSARHACLGEPGVAVQHGSSGASPDQVRTRFGQARTTPNGATVKCRLRLVMGRCCTAILPSSDGADRHAAHRPIRGPFRRPQRWPLRRPAPRRRSRHYDARRWSPRRRCHGPRRSRPTLPIRRWRCRTG